MLLLVAVDLKKNGAHLKIFAPKKSAPFSKFFTTGKPQEKGLKCVCKHTIITSNTCKRVLYSISLSLYPMMKWFVALA